MLSNVSQHSLYNLNQLNASPKELKTILSIVSEVTGESIEEIKGTTKRRDVALARQLYCFLAYKYTKYNGKIIGFVIGGRDYSTVSYSVKTIRDYVYVDDERVVFILSEIESRIRNIYRVGKRF